MRDEEEKEKGGKAQAGGRLCQVQPSPCGLRRAEVSRKALTATLRENDEALP